MSYIAIARKWRPQRFSEIAGQGHVTRTLENAIQLNRVHHAYLFSGPRGVGKTTAARALARALNCEKAPTISPCDTCVACQSILAGSSPIVIEIDGASNNSVDDIRELRESVQYLPSQGHKKVYIIDEVHMLSKGAFNALLKTLEEPPGHVMFVFATTEPHKIPDTILSRVQRFEFKRIPPKTVIAQLRKICDAEEIKIDDASLFLIARAGEGSMRDSQSLLDQVISFSGTTVSHQQVTDALGLVDRALIYQMFEGIINRNPDLCLESIDQVYNNGYDLSEFSSELLELLRNATMVVLSPKSHRFLDIPSEEKEHFIELSKNTNADVFVRSFQVILDAHEQIARSPHPKLSMEMAVAKLVSIRPAKPIDDLVSRLRILEASGGPRAPRQKSSRRNHRTKAEDDEPSRDQANEKSHDATMERSTSPTPNDKAVLNAETLKPIEKSQSSTGIMFTSDTSTVESISQPDFTEPTTEVQAHGTVKSQESPPLKADYPLGFTDERLVAFHDRLMANSDQLTIWAKHCTISPPKTQPFCFTFDSKFNYNQAVGSQKEQVLLEVIKECFKIDNFTVKIDHEPSTETYSEQTKRLLEERRNQHTESMRRTELFNHVTTILNARFLKFIFKEELQ